MATPDRPDPPETTLRGNGRLALARRNSSLGMPTKRAVVHTGSVSPLSVGATDCAGTT